MSDTITTMNTHRVIIEQTTPDGNDYDTIYTQSFAALDVSALITHLNSMPPPKAPRAKRKDAGTKRNPTPSML